MIKKTITYEDFDGNKRTEDFYFNLTKREVLEMQLEVEGGFATYVRRIIASQSTPELIKIFRMIIDESYGVKSDDGKYFEKNEKLLNAFKSTNAYSDLYMELVYNDKFAAEFINGVVPSDMKVSPDEIAKVSAEIGIK